MTENDVVVDEKALFLHSKLISNPLAGIKTMFVVGKMLFAMQTCDCCVVYFVPTVPQQQCRTFIASLKHPPHLCSKTKAYNLFPYTQ
jgi:hypothetical protein